MSKEIQHKGIGRPLEHKETREDGIMRIKAYALAFDNVDSYGDVILPTACDAFLASENAARLKLCYQHDQHEVIGVITDKGVDAIGMWIEAEILPTTTGKDVQLLLDAGAIDEFSIGYYADKYRYEKRDGYPYEVRVLEAITVIEVSPVTRAANPKAVLTDKKEEDNNINPNNPENMEDMKKQLETIEQKAAAAEKKAADLAAELEAKNNELKTAQDNINNLDESVKSQEAKIAELCKKFAEQPQTFAKAMRAALEEKKETIESFFKKGTGVHTIEFKVASPEGAVYGSTADPNVHAVPVLGNAFILAFRNTTVTGNKVAWVEASTTKNVGYVAELASASKSDVTFVEKTRNLAKIATYMEISSEVEGWFQMLYDFCVAEGQRIIMKYADEQIWKGAGSDASKPKEVYGIKGAATAFAALGKYQNAQIGDVILDAIAQIQKAGYRADVAIVSYGTLAKLRGVKNAQGNYLYNELTGMFGQVTVYPSDQLADTELLVADSYCAEIIFAPLYELEFSRQASTDSWRVDLRRHVQVKLPTAKKAGVVYVANVSTAITSISEA